MELDRKLWRCGVDHLMGVGIVNLDRIFYYAKKHPEKAFNPAYSKRVLEFEEGIELLNNLFKLPCISIDKKYKNLRELKQSFECFQGGFIVAQKLITPDEVTDIYSKWKKTEKRPEIGETIDPYFEKLRFLIVTNTPERWDFPTKITDNPDKVISGMLIEGYGLFLEGFYNKPGIREKFVRAFEEVLVIQKSDSELLKDVVGWMKEEEAEFPGTFSSEVISTI